jgi:hypothetical protein
VIVRPSTEQIILDCRRELLDVIGPEVTSETGKISVQMIENVLRNCATRAAHEISWMRDETIAMEAFARDTLALHPAAHVVAAALTALDGASRTSLHLDDVASVYSLTGEAFSCALEVALGAGDEGLSAQGAALVAARSATEVQIMGEWGFVGRG